MGSQLTFQAELAGVFHGKTLGYFDGCNSEQLRQAHELVTELIAAEGEPFDAVLANSQGASLAISYLIEQQIKHPNEPSPFGFAVLFTPGIIISPDRDYKTKEIMSFLDKLDKADINKILVGLLTSNGRAIIEPEKFIGLANLSPRERNLCLNLVYPPRVQYFPDPKLTHCVGPVHGNTPTHPSLLQSHRIKCLPRSHWICGLQD